MHLVLAHSLPSLHAHPEELLAVVIGFAALAFLVVRARHARD